MTWTLPIGAEPGANGTRFRVWAPAARRVEVVLFEAGKPAATHPMALATDGYHEVTIPAAAAGAHYMYRVDGRDPRPDPASRSQPGGVHGPSAVVDPRAYEWHDEGWRGVALDDMVIYELHVGAATEEGTFDALIRRLDDIRALGATAIELMPVADFPGERNWGYDGVCLFAPARAYGGAEGLKRLVDAAHARGLAVLLDVVYNHLGPDGNYLREYSPDYFTGRHTTPWGDALNVDGPDSEAVRAFFINNALYWAHEYHIDGLRLDATHEIKDDSPVHILAELAQTVRASLPEGRRFVLIAENEDNDPAVVTTKARRHEGHEDLRSFASSRLRGERSSGWGLDGVWADDFHHQVRVALTGEREGYYADYSGSAADIAATLRQGWFYQGQPAPHSGEPRGAPTDGVPASAFVYCIQNHDQVGNRALGDRLNHAVAPAAYRAASVLLLLSPYTPLLWMGQEWAASTPFLFFTDHNPELGRLVTEGRRREFARFTAFSHHEVPDPQAEQTFRASKLRWAERETGEHAAVLRLYHDLLELRRALPVLRERGRDSYTAVSPAEGVVALRRRGGGGTALLLVNLGGPVEFDVGQTEIASPAGVTWTQLWSSEAVRYGGRDEARCEGDRVRFGGPGALLLRAEGEHERTGA
jgi:maltooligosyltrehalose trehalohydrolase